MVAEAFGNVTNLGARHEYDVGQAVLLERRDVHGPEVAAPFLQDLVSLELAERPGGLGPTARGWAGERRSGALREGAEGVVAPGASATTDGRRYSTRASLKLK